jgi:hypothetical protein
MYNQFKNHKMKKITFLLAAFAFFIACNKDSDEFSTSGVGQDVSLTPRTTKAFKASLQSSLNLIPPVVLTVCSGDIPEFAIPDHFLAGQALHLGKLNGVLSTLHHDNCNISFADAELTTGVSGQITGANGDKITYAGDDVIDITALLIPSENTSGSITGHWTITGGTGKFAGATGSIDIAGTVDFTTNTFNAEATGTINY